MLIFMLNVDICMLKNGPVLSQKRIWNRVIERR
jgi:hypothetical protein